MFELIKNVNIDFISKRKIAGIVSGIVIVAGLVSLVAHGGPLYSIDFEGGTEVQVQFTDAASVESVRDALSSIGYGDAAIREFGNPNEILIHVKTSTQSEEQVNTIRGALASIQGEEGYEIRRLETVGPKIGKELRGDMISAVLIAMAGIVIYISIRFQFMYSIGALVALIHDVVITLGIFSLMNIEISLSVLAAFLFIVGYSLNDTIVVFDRIRENAKVKRHDEFGSVINTSLNQTLNRTIITSLTTLTVVIILLTMGGEVIKPFAFALTVGLVVGTYSSIFVASPVVLAWDNNQKKKVAQK
ncbi:MAG: protein translocase subunit SecF [Candidatus Marinimicrobia bacterium]|nr:protein translocase subunit SecF [Candidatus Neomarinimicrobiota bacterium]MCF7851600.1 protein translocase subunit SecF [Candidatus Neomarinimicrobiota bacterium]MCF7905402.1 protein translocase subunit SecF [Candidatus Neomarinimicrobiota bacterium]